MFGSTKIKVKGGNVRIKHRPPNKPAEWAMVALIALVVLCGVFMIVRPGVFL